MAMAVRPILGMVPPDPSSLAPSDLRSMLRLGRHMRGLGAEHFHALFKLMTMSSADYLDEWYEFDPLKATKSASGIIGTFLGPRSPGSAYVLLHHYMGEIDGAFRAWGFQRGGTGAISETIASAARAQGAEIRTDAAVAHVLVRDGRVRGVALENGDEMLAPIVVSSLDPRRTFLDLVDRQRTARRRRERRRALQVPRLVGQGESRAERSAALHVPRAHRRRGVDDSRGARRVLDQPEHGISRARVRRREVRRVLAAIRTWTS